MASLRGILALAQISGKVEVDSEAVISCDSIEYECRQPPALSHLMYSWSLVWSYLCFVWAGSRHTDFIRRTVHVERGGISVLS